MVLDLIDVASADSIGQHREPVDAARDVDSAAIRRGLSQILRTLIATSESGSRRPVGDAPGYGLGMRYRSQPAAGDLPAGATVMSVDPGGSADAAEVRAGDVVIELAGSRVLNARDLSSSIEGLVSARTSAVVALWRDGARVEVEINWTAPRRPNRAARNTGLGFVAVGLVSGVIGLSYFGASLSDNRTPQEQQSDQAIASAFLIGAGAALTAALISFVLWLVSPDAPTES